MAISLFWRQPKRWRFCFFFFFLSSFQWRQPKKNLQSEEEKIWIFILTLNFILFIFYSLNGSK